MNMKLLQDCSINKNTTSWIITGHFWIIWPLEKITLIIYCVILLPLIFFFSSPSYFYLHTFISLTSASFYTTELLAVPALS